MGRIWKVLTRKKAIDPVAAEETRLNRILNTFDLTALGVGSTLGVGVYVLAGQVAKDTAGPAVVLSFLIAAVASVFAGLCYAEFGARAPRAGSAYIYSYVCVGEFIAFVIGWNLILEYVIGSASVARGLSLYLDTLINNTLQDTFREIAPINVNFLSPYFDFFSFGISVLLAIALAFGLKESSMANNIVTGLNVLVVLFVVIAGSIKADSSNWHISPNNTNTTSNSTVIGKGGFFPFGVEGMIKGAATCFYGFVGFDCIATTGEEVKNPRKAIPISIIVSLFIIFLAYFGTSTVLTLMVPYYLQDHNAPIPRAFEMIGWDWAKWVVAIGALFGLCASLFGAMFPLPRIIYAMGSDGLLFKFLAKVSPKFQTPVTGTLVAGILTGFMSAIFDLRQLVNMMSIGTLLAYTIVAASVLLLRYKEEEKKVYVPIKTSSDTESTSSESSVDDRYNDDGIRQNFDGPTTSDEQELINTDSVTCSRVLKYIFNFKRNEPNRITERIVVIEVFNYCILCIGIGLCAIYLKTPIVNGEVWAICITSVIVALTVILMMSLATQPTSKKELSFKVPFVPIIPALSILVNIYLMLMLDYRTWIRFAVWMVMGIPMYCMCACSQKQPYSHQNGSNYTSNISNGHAKIANGISNPTFVTTEPSENETTAKTTKKKALAPSPPVNDQKENIEVQQEAAIAQLDEILDKEVAIAQLDDILNDETCRISDRKLSAGTLSNMSAVVSRYEDVVADVHRANVSTPVANPKSLPFPSVRDSPSVLNNDTSEDLGDKNQVLGEPVVETSSLISEDSNKKEVNLKSGEALEVLDIVVLNDLPSNNSNFNENKVHDAVTDELKGTSAEESNDKPKDEVTLLTVGALKQESPSVPVTSIEPTVSRPENESKYMSSNDNSNEKSTKEAFTPTKDGEIVEDKADNSPKVSFATSTQTRYEEPANTSTVPTKEALKSVTLRHVKKQIKEIEKSDNENASDDNLRVGSEEYKNFMKNLDNKLKRVTVIPSLYPLPKKDIIIKPKEVVPNENVIEEKIDKEIAKEKLKSFIQSSLLGENDRRRESKLESPKKLLRDEGRSISVNDASLMDSSNKIEAVTENVGISTDSKKDIKEDDNDEKLTDTINNDSLSPAPDSNHKLKMENVFHSIRLRKLETKGDQHLKRRLSKSLGSSFAKEEDQSEHKQKMSDIFKSIKAIPKEGLNDEEVN